MVARKRGKIINIGSMFSFFGFRLAIAPGWIEADMTAPLHGTPYGDEILMRTPAGRWGKTEEMGGAAVFLAAPASDFVTGETIRVDGGYAIR